ncbi:MAG TPA: isoleucine--tRNA ligase [Clostridia bacterium]|nr:isoleucine--tRNA ligase [Clostridia bacterium]
MDKKDFKPVAAKVDFPRLEKHWLEWWQANNILPKYLKKNQASKKKFFFLDGPITANNPMAVHHAWGRTYKDLFQRFKNMQGFAQTFRNGFDNQGLWVEVEVEKQLGFKTKKEIGDYGIENFVKKCKESTLHWAEVQTEQSKRLGYFMDWNNSYYTMSDENNYTIWHFLKQCYQKGLIYKGKDSVPWCPRCGTAISQHEILQEEYQEVVHDSVYLRLPFADSKGKVFKDEYLLVWTTTPWTIPANALVAVNPEIKYAKIAFEGKKYWLALSAAKKIFKKDYRVEKEVTGKKLLEIGRYYQGPFDDLPVLRKAKKANPQAFHSLVLSKELVSEEEGTGLVHIAPGCGAEDFALAARECGYPEMVIPAIDESACYLEGFGRFSTKNAKTAPEIIMEFLKEHQKGKFLFKTEPFTHRYPICWRCKEELVWRVVDEWYIKMDPLREPIKKSAKQARWIPAWGLEREIDWLNHMSDWLISKKRFWGLALPIWECPKCKHFEVIGSKEELAKKAVEGWEKFEGHSPHRPWIDAVKIKCSKCGQLVSRVPDVGNPWLDAGIVPFSTLIDPQTGKVSYLSDKKYWQQWYPADFITECFPGQFKNWFYSILAMSTVLERKSPFKTLLGHALVRDEKGEEMHKSKGNAIWFDEAAEKMGVDVMRWMYLTQNPELNLNFGYHIANETRRRFHLPLWHVYKFFVTYANLDKFKATATPKISKNILDQWILSRLSSLIKLVTESLENYDAYQASRAIQAFVEDLSSWYIRRSRERVGAAAIDRPDKESFYQTSERVLLALMKLLAPFVPFLGEEIFKNLSEEESVHLQAWPKADKELINKKLEGKMALVRKVVEIGHSQRREAGIKVRQPLASLVISNLQVALEEPFVDLIKDELNVKEVKIKLGKGELALKLNTTLTPELKAEGEAREIIRQIQRARKEAGCRLTQEIEVGLPSWPEEFEEEIKKKTLAKKLYQAEKLEIKGN